MMGALSWVLALENSDCQCSKNWRRLYMKWFYIFTIILQIGILIQNRTIIKYLDHPVHIASIGYIYVTWSYVNKLIDESCDCTSGRHRSILLLISWVQFLILLFSSIFSN